MKKIILALIYGFCTLAEAQAFSVEHKFKVILGPFDASDTKFTYALTDKDYRVRSTVKTAGMFNTLYPFKANYATTGRIVGDNLETASYHYDSQSRFNKRTKELVYNDQGEPIYRLSSKNGKEKKVNIDYSPDNKDTTDLQTVFAELARQYNKVKFCDSRMQVFDGKRRFDVVFRDEGQEELTANEYSHFKGMAAKCSLYIDKLGAQGDDLLWELTSDRPIYFWILEDGNSHRPFIARVMVEDTPLGRLDVYATQIDIKP